MNRLATLLLVLFVVAATGCTTEKRTYTIAAKNRLSDPVTVWVYKVGKPTEAEWYTPEDFAMAGHLDEDPNLGFIIPPGKIVDSPALVGEFEPDARAYLRVYRGQIKLSEMLASNRGSVNRQDVMLLPGHNAIIIDSYANALRVTRIDRAMAENLQRSDKAPAGK